MDRAPLEIEAARHRIDPAPVGVILRNADRVVSADNQGSAVLWRGFGTVLTCLRADDDTPPAHAADNSISGQAHLELGTDIADSGQGCLHHDPLVAGATAEVADIHLPRRQLQVIVHKRQPAVVIEPHIETSPAQCDSPLSRGFQRDAGGQILTGDRCQTALLVKYQLAAAGHRRDLHRRGCSGLTGEEIQYQEQYHHAGGERNQGQEKPAPRALEDRLQLCPEVVFPASLQLLGQLFPGPGGPEQLRDIARVVPVVSMLSFVHDPVPSGASPDLA